MDATLFTSVQLRYLTSDNLNLWRGLLPLIILIILEDVELNSFLLASNVRVSVTEISQGRGSHISLPHAQWNKNEEDEEGNNLYRELVHVGFVLIGLLEDILIPDVLHLVLWGLAVHTKLCGVPRVLEHLCAGTVHDPLVKDRGVDTADICQNSTQARVKNKCKPQKQQQQQQQPDTQKKTNATCQPSSNQDGQFQPPPFQVLCAIRLLNLSRQRAGWGLPLKPESLVRASPIFLVSLFL